MPSADGTTRLNKLLGTMNSSFISLGLLAAAGLHSRSHWKCAILSNQYKYSTNYADYCNLLVIVLGWPSA